MSTEYFVDGISHDYPEELDPGIGMVNCCFAAHGIQEAVDPETGETIATIHGDMRQWRARPGGSNDQCPICTILHMQGKDPRCPQHRPPDRPGVCQACWLNQRDPSYWNCPLHGVEKKLPGIEDCRICVLDPVERIKKDEHVEKLERIARETAVHVDDDPEWQPAPPAPALIPVATAAMLRDAIRFRSGR